MKRRVGVVADDITGANDIGVMFSKNGFRSVVIPMEMLPRASAALSSADVVILDTDSRFDKPREAAQKVRAATAVLLDQGFDLYYNKTCSVFRGNIGAEFDAMQDVLGQACSMIVLGLPKLGRTTLGGIHYLNGTRLDRSGFRNDPIHPATEADLKKILARQSPRSSVNFPAEDLDLPPEEQRLRLEERKRNHAYVIFDVRDQRDLVTIAALLRDERNICGSSGLAEELPRAWGQQGADAGASLLHPLEDPNGALVLAGSLTEATKAQVARLLQAGIPACRVEPEELLEGRSAADCIREAAERLLPHIVAGRTALAYTQNDPARVRAAKELAARKGLDDGALGKEISSVLGGVARTVAEAAGSKKVVVAGGDTSKAVSKALGVTHMAILREIEPGVPAMYGYSAAGELLMVCKSGSFGSEEFLVQAVRALADLQSV